MPNYSYVCVNCDTDEDRIVKIEDRDEQRCDRCGYRLNRIFAFDGIVWAPSSTGGGHK